MGIAETLTKQAGPLPVGAWIAVVGGGLGLAFYANKTGSKQPSDELISVGTDPGVGMGAGSPGFLPVGPPTPTAPTDFADNDAWARAALSFLVSKGHSPTASSIAVRKYIDGSSWTQAEGILIKAAIQGIGAPPIVPIGGGEIPAPIPPTPTTSSPGIWVTSTSVNPTTQTLQGMAKRFLGYYAGWGVIFNANRQGVKRPDGTIGMVPISGQLKPGWRIWIPGGKYAP